VGFSVREELYWNTESVLGPHLQFSIVSIVSLPLPRQPFGRDATSAFA
jgi:hypothetical protein